MRKRGDGRVVFVSSGVGVTGFADIAPYASSKGAIESFGFKGTGSIDPRGLRFPRDAPTPRACVRLLASGFLVLFVQVDYNRFMGTMVQRSVTDALCALAEAVSTAPTGSTSTTTNSPGSEAAPPPDKVIRSSTKKILRQKTAG